MPKGLPEPSGQPPMVAASILPEACVWEAVQAASLGEWNQQHTGRQRCSRCSTLLNKEATSSCETLWLPPCTAGTHAPAPGGNSMRLHTRAAQQVVLAHRTGRVAIVKPSTCAATLPHDAPGSEKSKPTKSQHEPFRAPQHSQAQAPPSEHASHSSPGLDAASAAPKDLILECTAKAASNSAQSCSRRLHTHGQQPATWGAALELRLPPRVFIHCTTPQPRDSSPATALAVQLYRLLGPRTQASWPAWHACAWAWPPRLMLHTCSCAGVQPQTCDLDKGIQRYCAAAQQLQRDGAAVILLLRSLARGASGPSRGVVLPCVLLLLLLLQQLKVLLLLWLQAHLHGLECLHSACRLAEAHSDGPCGH